MKANDRRNISNKCPRPLQGIDFITQPDNVASTLIGIHSYKKILNPFIISRQATTICAGDDGMPVLVSSLIFKYALSTGKILKS